VNNAQYLKALREQAKENGQCSICRARRADIPLLTCSHCRDVRKQTRAGHLARGKCQCGRARKSGCVSCHKCLMKASMLARRQYVASAAKGECTQCRRTAARNRTMCELHLERLRNYAAACRYARGAR
jgi:hypothetical protein